ncbi:winged helix-turn-helix transcriptional regulator [archaeon]|jgi:repressor of nif and glnA expression|nr:winged helix-turn-helix transcriptional regulator [archaeon]
MMKKKKRIRVDGTDRDILRIMNKANRPLSGNFIAKKVKLSSPAIRPRLNILNSKGIVKPIKIGGKRSWDRTFSSSKKTQRISAPSKILWGLDIISTKKKRRKKK